MGNTNESTKYEFYTDGIKHIFEVPHVEGINLPYVGTSVAKCNCSTGEHPILNGIVTIGKEEVGLNYLENYSQVFI